MLADASDGAGKPGGANDKMVGEREISKTFNQFHQLYNDLRQEGYINLPRLPDKTLLQVSSQDGLEKRRQELQTLLQQLIKNKEHMNAREVISFLGLHEFCPELLCGYPQLLYEHKEKAGYSVSHCVFIPKYKLFITISNNKRQQRSFLKVHSFKTSSAVEDSYLLKPSGSKPQRSQQSFGQKSQYNMQQKNPQLSDPDSMVRLPMSDKCEVECLFEYRFANTLIHTCDYHREQDFLCLGTSRGQLLNYDIRVEPDCLQFDFKAKE